MASHSPICTAAWRISLRPVVAVVRASAEEEPAAVAEVVRRAQREAAVRAELPEAVVAVAP